MSGLRELKKQRAREWVLAHPDQSKDEQAKGAGCSGTLISQVRAQLIVDGLLAPSRKGQGGQHRTPPASSARSTGAGDPAAAASPATKPPTMLDHEAMQAMADMIALADSGDDEEVHRRLAKQCLTFAFNPNLHPDTRMSASQMWAKFRDQRKSLDLGPGIPLTYDAAKGRLVDMLQACGPKMVLEAVNEAFDVKESTNAEAADEQAAPPGGTATAPSPV